MFLPIRKVGLVCLLMFSAPVWAQDAGISGVRLEDLIKHRPQAVSHLGQVNREISANLSSVLGGRDIDRVLNIVIDEKPTQNGDSVIYPMTAFIRYKNGQIQFEKILVTMNSQGANIRAQLIRSIPLSQTDFKVTVGLVERVAQVVDEEKNIRMVFPLGVGSFDEGILNQETSLLTPRFRTAYLSKHAAIQSRTTPKYFAGKPFIRILDGEKKAHTAIGFHAQPNLDPFIRAFDSHGCMRMQTNDLEALYFLVAHHSKAYIPITVSYNLDEEVAHPFPKRESSYQGIMNTGSKNSPSYTIDRDYLVQTASRKGAPPVHLLYDFDEDHNEEYFNYSSEPCKIKSFGKEPKNGWSSSLTSTLAWERCDPRKQRNTLYRLWVHR